jgi:O-antigen/teichoic acid export membrane protein
MKVARLLSAVVGKYKENILHKRFFTVLSIDILFKVSGILLLPVYLRLMTQEEYGLYNYLLSIILTFSLVLNFGLNIPLGKFYHDYKDEFQKGKLLFTLSSLLAIALFPVIFIIYFFGFDYKIVNILFKNEINYSHYRFAIMMAVIVSVLNFMLTSFFFTSEKINYVKRYNVWRIICINIITIGLLYFFKDNDKVELRLISTYLIELILLLFFSYFLFSEMILVFNSKTAISAIKLAVPIMLSAIFGIVINFGDKFFLEKYGNFTDLSNYFLAASCAGLIPMIFTSVQNVWLPVFFKEKDLSTNFFKTKKLIGRLLLLFLFLAVSIMAFVKMLLVFNIIPSTYHQVILILPILLVSQIISSLVPLYSNYLIYFEKTYIVAYTGFFICFIVYTASILLIPRFGVYGAAFVSVISNLVYFIIYYFIINNLANKHLLSAT